MDQKDYVSEAYRGTTALVIGASGFIGRWVAHDLCKRGANVHLLVRDKTKAQKIFSDYEVYGSIFELDLRNDEAFKNAFSCINPSITFNLAGYGVDRAERDSSTAFQINGQLLRTICEAAAERRDPHWLGQDIVHIGSALEYGDIGGNLCEESMPKPTTLYGRSKLKGTQILSQCCKVSGVKGLTARLFTVYGPGEHEGRLLPSLLQTSKTGCPLPLTAGLQKRDFTYIEDVAEGLLRLGLSTSKPGEIVNLATGWLTPVRAFAETTATILQIPSDKLVFGAIPSRAEEMDHAEVSLVRMRRLIAWAPQRAIAEGIRRTLDFNRHGGVSYSLTNLPTFSN